MWTIIIILFFYLFLKTDIVQKIGKDLVANWLSKMLVEVHHKYYIVNYPYGMEWYKIKIPRNRNPTVVFSIMSEETSVTESIIPFMGPGMNFHGIPTTPEDLGFDSLKFETLENDIIFNSEDEIKI